MITDNGKAYIARNFGVNNCYAMEEIVPCTVYTDGTPNVRTLDTSTILFVLVTEVADKVKTAAGTFTLANLLDANDGSYISMMDALEIGAYCITGAPPVPPTAKITKAGIITELGGKGAIDIEAVSTVVRTNRWYMVYGRLNWHTPNFEKGIEIRNLQTRNPPSRTTDISLTENRTSVSELDRSWVMARIAELPFKAPVTPPYTPPVTPPVTPPPIGAKDYEIINPTVSCDSYNCYVKLNIKNNTNTSSSLYMRVDVDGTLKFKRHVYILKGATKAQSMALPFTGIKDGYHNLTIAVGKVVDTDTYTHRFLVGAAGIEPPAKITKAGIITELGGKGAIDIEAVSTVVRTNRWYMVYGRLNWHTPNFEKGIEIRNLQTRNPPSRTTDISLTENRTSVSELDRSWVMARIAELPFKAPVTPPYTPPVTPPYTPPVTPPSEPPEAIKAWVVANYGDGTRVTTDGWRKLNVAKMANTLAPLPAGYTKASITEGVVLWAKANPNWEIQTLCGWISAIGVTNLTEDHGLYVYNLAIGWATLANSIYATLSPKPSEPPSASVTEDNGLGVYDYAIGWNTIANTITRCNF